MTDFTITEDFPKSEIEFDERFSNPKACYDYLFKQKWPDGFVCKKVALIDTAIVAETFIFAQNASTGTH
jgi:hypothetical protein